MPLFGKRRSNEPPRASKPVDDVGDLIKRLNSAGPSASTAAGEELRRLRRESSDPEVKNRIARALLEHQKARGAVRKAQRDAPPLKSPAWLGDPSIPRREVEFKYPHPGTDHWTEVKVIVNARGEILSEAGPLIHTFLCKSCPDFRAERSFIVLIEELLKRDEVQRAIRELQAAREGPSASPQPRAAACAVCGIDLTHAPAVRDNMTGALYCFEHREHAAR